MSKRPRSTGTAKKSLPPPKKVALQRTESVSLKRALMQSELKFNDVTLNTDANTTPVVTALTTFGTGDTALLRDGNKALVKSVAYRISFQNSALTQSNTVRVVLVCDKLSQAEQCNWGTAATVADVFDAETVVARRAVLTASRFKILADDVIVINETAGTGGGTSMAYLERYVKIPQNLQLTSWSSASSVIPMVNALSIMYIGTTASGAADVTVLGSVRVRFEG